MRDKAHSVILQIDANENGFDLDMALAILEAIPGVIGAVDLITYNAEEEEGIRHVRTIPHGGSNA